MEHKVQKLSLLRSTLAGVLLVGTGLWLTGCGPHEPKQAVSAPEVTPNKQYGSKPDGGKQDVAKPDGGKQDADKEDAKKLERARVDKLIDNVIQEDFETVKKLIDHYEKVTSKASLSQEMMAIKPLLEKRSKILQEFKLLPADRRRQAEALHAEELRDINMRLNTAKRKLSVIGSKKNDDYFQEMLPSLP